LGDLGGECNGFATFQIVSYSLERQDERFNLVLSDVVYTEYWAAINRISTPEAGKLEDFIEVLQQKLDNKLDNPPDTQTITDIPLQ
jgi:hypothetical protein